MTTALGRDGALEVVEWLYKLPQFDGRHLDADTARVWLDELEDLPLGPVTAQGICRSLLAVEDRTLPNPQSIRRRILGALGLLAPPWEEALLMVHDAIRVLRTDSEPFTATRAALDALPGPVNDAVRAKGGLEAIGDSDNEEATFAQLRDTYKGLERRHNQFVLEPGGPERFAQVCAAVAQRRERRDLRQLAQWAAQVMELRLHPTTDGQAAAVIGRYVEQFGEAPKLGVRPGVPGQLVAGDVSALTARIGR